MSGWSGGRIELRGALRSLLVAGACAGGLAAVGLAASARDCKDSLSSVPYACQYVLEGEATSRPMTLFFSKLSGPEMSGSDALLIETGPEMYLAGPETGGAFYGQCACTAKKPDSGKPEKIGFRGKQNFHCVLFAPAHSGAEQFNFGAASYEGRPSNGKIERGEAVDLLGRPMVFDCVESPLHP